MENTVGPLLSDKELYEVLDTVKYPELAGCIKANEAGDTKTARKIFADTVKKVLDPEKFFSHPSRNAKPELTAATKGTAERALRHDMWSCGTPMHFDGKVDWFANPTYNQYKEWTWQLSRHDELVHLSRAYRACGDQRYADGCAELLDSWLKQAVRPEYSSTGYMTLCWRTIECGIRMGLMWPEIIHTFINNEAFTDDLIVDFCKSVYEHSLRMINAFTMGNWHMHELNGLGQSGMFYPFFKDSAEWISICFTRMERELTEMQVYPDGLQFETSTGYHGVVLHHVMEVIEVALIYGIEVPSSMFAVVENMLMMYVKLVQANKKLPHPNDGGGGAIKGTISRYAKYFPENEIFKWVATDGAEGNEPDFRSILLEYSGQAALRPDWNWDTSAYIDVGPYGRAHQHEDKLNVTIANSEKVLLCEANTYAYDTSEARKYCLAARGHNVINVNGMEQNRRANYKWDTSMLSLKAAGASITLGDETDTVECVYDEQFGDGSVKAEHRRKLVMLKKPKLGKTLYIVVDNVVSDTENEYEAMWHYDVKGAKLEDGKFVSDEITQFVCGDTGAMRIACGELEPKMQGWICRTSRQRSEEPVPTLLHTVKGKCVTTVNVFSVHGSEGSAVKNVSYEASALTVTYTDGSNDVVKL